MPLLELIQAFLAPQVLLFLLFGTGALVTALIMLLHPNPIRSALFLVLNLFCVAVLYLLLNAYFLAAVQVVVYAGAIMVLFLFVIMLLNLGTPDRTVDRLRLQTPFAAVAGLVLAGAVGLTLVRTMPLPVLDKDGNVPVVRTGRGPRVASRSLGVANASGAVSAATGGAEPPGGVDEGAVIPPRVGTGGAATGVEAAGPTVEGAARLAPRTVPVSEQGTVAGIGQSLYNAKMPYLFAFEVTSILLLIATIGSVVLAQRKTPAEKSLDAGEIA